MSAVLLREDLAGRRPYGAPQLDVAVRLNTNENPFPPPAALLADLAPALAAAAGTLNRYPDREALELRAALASYLTGRHGVRLGAERVWAANGSNEILQQLLQAYGGPGRTVLCFTPSYSMQPLLAEVSGTRFAAVAKNADFTVDADLAARAVRELSPHLVLLTSPDNPTGLPVGRSVLEAVLAAAPGLVVVDEAYAEFSPEPSALELLDAHPHLVVTRTMSKAFAMAGTRLGYLAAHPDVVDALRVVRLPYHLSTLTQTAARVALRHAAAVLATVDTLAAARDGLVGELHRRGVATVPSAANFLLFAAPGEQQLWQELLDLGVLVRDVGLTGWLRVTVGLAEENAAFLAALDRIGGQA